mgnify:CR=1 FL=1
MYCVPDDYKCVNKTIVRTFVPPDILTKEPVESTKEPEELVEPTKEREEPEEPSLTKEPEEPSLTEEPDEPPITKEPDEPEPLPINVVTFINGKKVKDLKQYCQQLSLSYKNLRKQELKHILCEYMIKQDNPSQCMASIDGSFMNH